MAEAEQRPFKRITIRIFKSDLEALQQLYPTAGYNIVIRQLVARHIKKVEDLSERKLEEANFQDNTSGEVQIGVRSHTFFPQMIDYDSDYGQPF